tara:strand:- start:5432 stop:7186 length:1755 start_codon:yes stop_codon:yes gene_type:complete
MAQIEGLQVNILANITQLEKALADAKKALASVAQESQKQSDNISNPLKGAADVIEARYGSLAGTIATRLLSLVNPATLAATAVTAIGAGLLAYFQSVQTNTASADEVLKTHGQLIKDLKAAYGEAMVGLEQYTKESENSFRNRIGASLIDLQKGVMEFSKTFIEQFGYLKYGPIKDAETGLITFGDTIERLPAKFEPFREALQTLQASVRAGNPDYITFKNSVDAIGAAAEGVNPPLNTLAKELVDGANKGFQFSTGINAGKDALIVMTPAAIAAAAGLSAFNTAIKALEGIAPKQIDDLTKARNAATKALESGNLTETQAKKIKEDLAATEKRIADEAASRVKTPKIKIDNSEAELAREQESITKRLELLTIGWGTEEEKLAAHLLKNADLINLAKQKEAIDDETHKILMLGAEEEYQKKMEGLRMAGINSALTATGEVFGAMARVVQAGGKKNVRLAKMFGIAEAIIATMVAANKAMAVSASAGPIAAFAAWAAVAAKGLATVAAIRSVSESGGGGSAAGAASGGGGGGGGAAAEAGGGARGPGGNSVYINLQGQSFGRDQVRDLVKQIADFQKDGGQVVFG